jgi:diadenosine tetraphosphate (Ap4A) HIT family hydrolase
MDKLEDECILCKTLKYGRFMLQNDLCFAFLDAYPVTEGRTLIVLKRWGFAGLSLTPLAGKI